MAYSPRGRKEWDMTEQLHFSQFGKEENECGLWRSGPSTASVTHSSRPLASVHLFWATRSSPEKRGGQSRSEAFKLPSTPTV